MNEAEMRQYITATFAGVDVVDAMEANFFFYNPDPSVPPDHMFPFVTIVINDLHDQFSNLNRPSVFRLNIGIGKETFRALFGVPQLPSDENGTAVSDRSDSGYDFTALDQLLPHPVYGRMYWVCVLNPSAATLETQVRPLLDEAYERAVSKYDRQAARNAATSAPGA